MGRSLKILPQHFNQAEVWAFSDIDFPDVLGIVTVFDDSVLAKLYLSDV